MVHPNDYCIWNAVSKQTLKFLNILLATCRYLMVSGTNPRELRGKLIASMKNAVKRISERTYRVSSQNGNGKYYDVRLNEENEWRCTCADFSYRSERDQDKVTGCKHIFAVEFSKKLREQVEKELVVIEPVIEIKAMKLFHIYLFFNRKFTSLCQPET